MFSIFLPSLFRVIVEKWQAKSEKSSYRWARPINSLPGVLALEDPLQRLLLQAVINNQRLWDEMLQNKGLTGTGAPPTLVQLRASHGTPTQSVAPTSSIKPAMSMLLHCPSVGISCHSRFFDCFPTNIIIF